MTEDITSLQIKILYDKVEAAEKSLAKLNTTGSKTAKAAKSWGDSLNGAKMLQFAAGATAVTAAIAGMRAVIAKTAEFQKLKAGLVTATGSAEKAAIAFQALQDYAQSTPSSLVEVTQAFTKLVNYGLTPSERALTAYGNTASAMGKTLNQMVEAVADATTGEFERLKEFGIKAKTEGDKITFRFRGVSTTVKNSAAEIEKYLIQLSEKNFGGAMAEQMKTLNGMFSALGDEWDKLLAGIGENGLGDAVGGGVRMVINLLTELNAQIASGQLQENLNSWIGGFQRFANAASEGLKTVIGWIDELGGAGELSGRGFVDDFMDELRLLPDYVRIEIEKIGGALGIAATVASEVAGAIYDSFVVQFNALVDVAKVTGYAIGRALAEPTNLQKIGQNYQDGLESIGAKTSMLMEGQGKRAANALVTGLEEYQGLVKSKAKELDDLRNANAASDKRAEDKRAKFDKDAADRKAKGVDRLAGMGVGVDTQGAGKAKKGGGGGGGSKTSEFDTLEKTLRDQETLISESYERRLALIEANTREGSAYQAELEISLTEKFEEEQIRRLDKMKDQPEKMFDAFAQEEKIIEDSYARRKEIILNATELTETERLKMLEEAELQYTDSMRKHEIERNKVAFGIAADFMGNISAIAGAFGKRGAKIAKAAAIAETTVKTYQAATSAYASLAGIPYVGPALGAAAAGAAIAAGLANVQKIKAQDDSGGYAGAYASGGIVPGASYHGDNLTASVNSGEAIFNKGQQKQLWEMANGNGGAGGGVEVKIINMTGEPVTQNRKKDGDKETLEFIIGQAAERVANDIGKGGTRVARAIESTYNMSRGKRA